MHTKCQLSMGEEEKSRHSTQPSAPEGDIKGKSFPAPDTTPSALITQLLQTDASQDATGLFH